MIDLGVNGVRVTLMPTVSSRAERSPDPRESAIFLELAEQVFDRFRPDVLLTYGGHPASLELMRRARAGDCRGLPPAQLRHSEPREELQRSQGLCRRLGRDIPVGILTATMPGCGSGWSGNPRPDLVRRIVAADLEPKYVSSCGAASSHRAAAQVRQVVHAQTLGDFPQPGTAGGEETAHNRPAASFCNRACQFSALLPSRSKIPASSPEITALPSRNNRPV